MIDKLKNNIIIENKKHIISLLAQNKRKELFNYLNLEKKNFLFSHMLKSSYLSNQNNLVQISKEENEYIVDLISIRSDKEGIKEIRHQLFNASDEFEILAILNNYFRDFVNSELTDKLYNSNKSIFIGMCE